MSVERFAAEHPDAVRDKNLVDRRLLLAAQFGRLFETLAPIARRLDLEFGRLLALLLRLLVV